MAIIVTASNKVGIRRGNIYGRKCAGNYFLKGLIALLKACEYSTTEFASCLYLKPIGDDFVLCFVCIDDFLVVSTT